MSELHSLQVHRAHAIAQAELAKFDIDVSEPQEVTLRVQSKEFSHFSLQVKTQINRKGFPIFVEMQTPRKNDPYIAVVQGTNHNGNRALHCGSETDIADKIILEALAFPNPK